MKMASERRERLGRILRFARAIASSASRSAKILVVGALSAYKWAISPLLPPACRYVPTCSEYALEAIEHYGVLGGAAMAIRRLLRCHPLAKGGYDPVPHRDRENKLARMVDGTA